jgi:hypothetical protein
LRQAIKRLRLLNRENGARAFKVRSVRSLVPAHVPALIRFTLSALVLGQEASGYQGPRGTMAAGELPG